MGMEIASERDVVHSTSETSIWYVVAVIPLKT